MSNPFDAVPAVVGTATIPVGNSDWRNSPATIDQIFGKKDWSTKKRKGGIVRMLLTKDLTKFPAGELRNLIYSLWSEETQRFEFPIDTSIWATHVMTKGQASEVMATLMALPSKPRQLNALAASQVETRQAPAHSDVDGYRYQQLPTGEMLRFKLTKGGEIDHRVKPEFIKSA